MKNLVFLLTALPLISCSPKKEAGNYKSKDLIIEKVAENTFVHVSYLETQDYGRVACNGMVVVDKGEALIFDTPIQDSVSLNLMKWITDSLKCKVIGVVATHFHNDCLGGLKAFHEKGIPSYASNRTINQAKQDSVVVPQNGFDDSLMLKIGLAYVTCSFLGEGHTKDNVVCYSPKSKVLFGGCLIKEVGAGKGYLGDANVAEWSNTVEKVKAKYQDLQVVIPGHGKVGGKELFDYTIELFKYGENVSE